MSQLDESPTSAGRVDPDVDGDLDGDLDGAFAHGIAALAVDAPAADTGTADPADPPDPAEPADPVPTSWVDPVADAATARAEEDAQIQADLAASRRPVRDTRGRKRTEWRQTERARRYAARRSVRFPIFTRSIVLWMIIFAVAGLTFGASGAYWWAQFNTEVTKLREDTRDFQEQALNAQQAIDSERNAALTQIREANKPLAGFLSEALIVQLAKNFETKVYFVETLDERGERMVGTAFAVASDKNETMLVTSLNTVRASTIEPAPGISLKKGADVVPATLWATDPLHDLALLRVERGDIPVMEWAGDDTQQRLLGARVFAVGGLGGNGAALVPGLVFDVSGAGIRHTVPIDMDFQGGPIINAEGKVVAVSSMVYEPGFFATSQTKFAPFVGSVCDPEGGVLSCGGGKKKKDQRTVTPPAIVTTTTTTPP